MRFEIIAGLAFLAASGTSLAAVSESGPGGFVVDDQAHIAVPPDKVYAALIEPGRWWNSDHTFSGDSANLMLEPRAGGCLCEKLSDGGSVEHLRVALIIPDKMLRLRGALGPFQAEGTEGALTFTLKPASDGTDLTLEYVVGGYFKGGIGKLPAAADGMLGDLVQHLKTYAEAHK